MASTYSSNLNIEIITSGEQAGTWGDTTNQNWKRVEQSVSKKSTVNLGGTTSAYSWELANTADADASGSEGRSAFVEFTNAGAAIAVNIRGNSSTDYPNRVFFAYNNSGYALTFDSNASSDFVLASGAAAAIYTDPGTAAGNIFNTFQVGSGAAGLVLSNGKIQALGGAVSFDDDNITNVGSISLASIAADDGSSFSFSNNWTAAGRTCANLGTVTTSGAVTLGGALTIGSAGSGHDVIFYSETSGDNFLWDASEEKLVITGADGTNALEVTDGNVSITDTLTATNIGAFNLTGKLTAGSNEIEGTNFNIDGGNISAVTISGDLTWSSNQDYGSSNLVTTGTLGAGATTVSSLNVSNGNITNGGDIDCDSVSVADAANGLNIDFSGSVTEESKITINNNVADALNVTDGSASFIKIATDTNNITFGQNSTFSGTTIANLGTVSAATSITSSAFVGPLTGDVTGNVSGTAGSATNATNATNATKVTVTDNESFAEENLIAFVADAATSTGNHGLEMDGNLTYNPSTGALTSTSFVGSLTGTLTTGAQTNITQVGNITAGSWDAPIHGTGGLGTNNIAIGANAGTNLASGGSENVFFGDEAGNDVTTGSGNVFIGYEAAHKMDTSNNNVIIGKSALPIGTGGSSNQNIAIGGGTLPDSSSGSQNIVIGHDSGGVVATGGNNIAIGRAVSFSGTGASYEIVLGNTCTGIADSVVIGVGSSAIKTVYNGSPTWTTVSDLNIKKNIVQETVGLSLINALNPVRFNYKTEEDFEDTENVYRNISVNRPTDIQYGFIAQEVEQAVENAGLERLDGLSKDENGVYSLGHTGFIQPMVKAIQELSSKIDSLESRLAALE
jgi:hypothetical protein